MIAFFASSPEEQILALPKLPLDIGERGFHDNFSVNPLHILVKGFLEESYHHDYEPWENFISRTEIPITFKFNGSAYKELRCLVDLIERQFFHGREALLTQKGLRRKEEWMLVRRLSQITLNELGWSNSFSTEAINQTIIKLFKEQKEG